MSAVQSQPPNKYGRNWHNTESVYTLPNDSTEHDRLEEQAKCIVGTMNGNEIHAPLDKSQIKEIIDVGCGSGFYTHRLAERFPDAQVIGVDFSPVPTGIREKLPNIEYVQGDIFELGNQGNADPRFAPGSFDFVSSRLLLLGMTDWPKYLDILMSLVKPGAYIEMYEADLANRRVPANAKPSDLELLTGHEISLEENRNKFHPTDAWEFEQPWESVLTRLMTAKGINIRSGPALPDLFVKHGFQDVHVWRYMFPISAWPEQDAVLDRFQRHNKKFIDTMLPMLTEKAAKETGAVTDEEVKWSLENQKDLSDTWSNGHRDFFWSYEVIGQKPL